MINPLKPRFFYFFFVFSTSTDPHGDNSVFCFSQGNKFKRYLNCHRCFICPPFVGGLSLPSSNWCPNKTKCVSKRQQIIKPGKIPLKNFIATVLSSFPVPVSVQHQLCWLTSSRKGSNKNNRPQMHFLLQLQASKQTFILI